MKVIQLIFACIAVCAATNAFAADPVRLGLWVSESIGVGNGDKCDLKLSGGGSFDLTATPPTSGSHGSHGSHVRLIHVDALDAVLGRLPVPADGQ